MTLLTAITAAGATGASTALASVAPVRHVDSDYTLLRSAPGSFVIGTAYKRTSIDVEGTNKNQSWYWARIGGHLHSCMWISAGATAPGGRRVSGHCGSPRSYYSGPEFTKRFTNGMIGSNAAGNDGVIIRLQPHGACPVHKGKIDGWGNVKPWLSTSRPSDRLTGYLTLGRDGASTSGKNLIKWRYVTRDGRYVMIHATRYDPTDGKGRQGWFFISRDCLPL